MKKLLFTALAVVVFIGVAMADTAEVKEKVVINNESKEVALQVASKCSDIAYITASLVEEDSENNGGGCLSSSDYNAVYMEAYNDCVN
jgi:hypothetical protein